MHHVMVRPTSVTTCMHAHVRCFPLCASYPRAIQMTEQLTPFEKVLRKTPNVTQQTVIFLFWVSQWQETKSLQQANYTALGECFSIGPLVLPLAYTKCQKVYKLSWAESLSRTVYLIFCSSRHTLNAFKHPHWRLCCVWMSYVFFLRRGVR